MTKELPSFSVIIPTYERPAQLTRCLKGLARLDYPRELFEVIVVDDGSSSPPRALVEEFRASLDVRLLEQRRNKGPAGARNFGAAHARGEFLAFTDDDCEAGTEWLRALASAFAKAPERIVGGRTLNSLTRNPYSETSQAIIEVVYSHFNQDPEDARFFASNNFAVPARLFLELRGFDERFTTSEDREICARWRTEGLRLAYAPDAIIYHAHHLGLLTLWRQHFGYGRGALRFHRARLLAGAPPFKPDMVFYSKLLRASASHERKSHAAQMTALLLWSQAANAAGFFYEKYRARRLP